MVVDQAAACPEPTAYGSNERRTDGFGTFPINCWRRVDEDVLFVDEVLLVRVGVVSFRSALSISGPSGGWTGDSSTDVLVLSIRRRRSTGGRVVAERRSANSVRRSDAGRVGF